MLATLPIAAIGNTSSDTTTTSKPDLEILIRDVTPEVLLEKRADWRDGYDSGLSAGCRRVLESQCLEQIVTELVLLREVAVKLAARADYWMAKSDAFEAEATYWHGVASGSEA